MSLNVIKVSTALALGLAATLLAVDLLAWREKTPFRTGGDQQCPQR
jgi:hypothetical protein